MQRLRKFDLDLLTVRKLNDGRSAIAVCPQVRKTLHQLSDPVGV